MAQLKKENVSLSRSLEAKTNQLESARQQIGIIKTDAQELKKQLEVSRKKQCHLSTQARFCFKKTDKEDGHKLKELLEGRTILKEELSRSKAMLEELEVLREQQQRQLIQLKQEGDLKNPELTDERRDRAEKKRIPTELLYRKQHQRDESNIKQLEQANL